MKETRQITIANGTVIVNGTEIFRGETTAAALFFKALYKHLALNYAKFYKMDLLCKLGFLASELLLAGQKAAQDENLAMVFANASSSINTDTKYHGTIKSIPSPALFVYTLPNIVMGEISIRHKFYGEQMFFIQPLYDPVFLKRYIAGLFEEGLARNAIFGWLEVDNDGRYRADLELCEK